jgi:hypothetical protein
MPIGERDYSGIKDMGLVSILKDVDRVSGELELPVTPEGLVNSSVRMVQGLTRKDFRSFIKATKERGIVFPDRLERRSARNRVLLVDGYNRDQIGALVVVNRSLAEVSLLRGNKAPYRFYDSTPWDEVYQYALDLVPSNPLRVFIHNPADRDKNLESRSLTVKDDDSSFVPDDRLKLGGSGDRDQRDLRTFFPEYSERQLATLAKWDINRMAALLSGEGIGGKIFDHTNHDILTDQVIPHEVQVFLKMYAARIVNREIKVGDELSYAFGGNIMRHLIVDLQKRPKLKNLEDAYKVMKERVAPKEQS